MDENEERLRCDLERYMKYCKEEELRLNAKKKEEDERRRKMEKMKNDMKNKEFTFDSNGNILPV